MAAAEEVKEGEVDGGGGGGRIASSSPCSTASSCARTTGCTPATARYRRCVAEAGGPPGRDVVCRTRNRTGTSRTEGAGARRSYAATASVYAWKAAGAASGVGTVVAVVIKGEATVGGVEAVLSTPSAPVLEDAAVVAAMEESSAVVSASPE